MPDHAEHGSASSQWKLDTSQSLSTPSNAPPSDRGVRKVVGMPSKPSPLDLTINSGKTFKLWKRRLESFFSPVLLGREATDDAVRRTGVVSRGGHIESGRQFRPSIGQEALQVH